MILGRLGLQGLDFYNGVAVFFIEYDIEEWLSRLEKEPNLRLRQCPKGRVNPKNEYEEHNYKLWLLSQEERKKEGKTNFLDE